MKNDPKFGVSRDEESLGDELRETESFGIRDEKGREIGYSIWYKRCTHGVAEPREWGCSSVSGFHADREAAATKAAELDETHAFYAESTATRNGQGFGAWKSGVFGATLDEVRAKIHKRRDGARKRYAKKYSDPK